jgi:pimeloyl-ACP methyl ester carboxylesterase/lysophospholipase L1-like esterase
MKHSPLLLLAALAIFPIAPARAQSQPTTELKTLKESDFQGFRRIDLKSGERDALLVFPEKPLPGNPWYWRTEFFGHEPQVDAELLRRGFHVAYLNVQNLYGAPSALDAMDSFYASLTKQFSLGKKTALAGFSRGGLFAFNWAARNPEKVAAIYGDNPVCDFKSWPGGKGSGKGSPADWQRLFTAYGFADETEALRFPSNPVDNLKPLANAGIHIVGFCGSADNVVPPQENILLVQQRYTELGGRFTLLKRPYTNHHPHSLRDPNPIADALCDAFGVPTAPGSEREHRNTPFGYNYHALRRGLPNFLEKARQNGTLRVAFLGGSITAMKGWRDLIKEDLAKRFPKCAFEFVDAGIGSLGSTPHAFRLERDVLSKGTPDLLILEAAVNDAANGHSPVEQIRAMEGIVRHTLQSNPVADILLLHFVDPEKIDVVKTGKRPDVIVQHEKVAAHYGLPSLDLAEEIAERIAAGEFTWEKDFKNLHPSPFGHDLYRKSINRLIDAALRLQTAPLPNARPGARTLPTPLDKGNYANGTLLPPDAVKPAQGWTLNPKWHPEGPAKTRPDFVDHPVLLSEGDAEPLSISFTGTGAGVFLTAGPDTAPIEFRTDGGAWEKRETLTRWSSGLHLPWALVLCAGLAEGPHTLEIRPVRPADHRSIRIHHFLINGRLP